MLHGWTYSNVDPTNDTMNRIYTLIYIAYHCIPWSPWKLIHFDHSDEQEISTENSESTDPAQGAGTKASLGKARATGGARTSTWAPPCQTSQSSRPGPGRLGETQSIARCCFFFFSGHVYIYNYIYSIYIYKNHI